MSSPSIISPSPAYSATVRMHLEMGTQNLAIAQMGPDFMILEEPVAAPPACADLVVRVDGDEKRRTIYLPDGIRASDVRTRIASA